MNTFPQGRKPSPLRVRRRFLAAIAIVIAFVCAAPLGALYAQPVPPIPGTWNLEFEDGFDGTQLNGANWKMGLADAGIAGQGGNNPANISVADGQLRLTATTDDSVFCGKTFAYSTGEVSSWMRFNQQYGYFEARMRWDTATGVWPAFWLMPEREDHGIEEWFNNTYLKFNLAGSGISTVTSATLRLTTVVVGNSTSSPNNLQVFAVDNDSWTEGGITWNNQPARDPQFLGQKWGFDSAAGAVVEFDVTPYVQAQVNGDGTVSLGLADEFWRARLMEFHSREASNSTLRPQLVVNGTVFTPVADATVKWGANANSNYGTASALQIRTAYSDSTDSTHNGGMEIDIMETLGIWGSNCTSHALHWDGYGSEHQAAGWGPAPVLDTSVYHTYGLYWSEGLIEFYVDGVKTGSYTDARAMSVPAYLILSLQLGGWDGNTPDAGVQDKKLDIDYVRVWSGAKSGSVPSSTTRDTNGDIAFGTDYTVYGGASNAGSNITVGDGGDTFSICRNGWIKFPMNYTVTADTVLEFTVDSSEVGEILGIGLDEDDNMDNAKRLFQLAGTQTWANAWQDTNNYPEETGPLTYVIPVGQYYTGVMSYLAISADSDAVNKIYALFANMNLREGGLPPGGGGETVIVGALNNGVAAGENRTGTGYLMYSEQNVVTRFGAYMGNADHIIAVFRSGGQWYADTNFSQVAFTPAVGDVLLASVNFTSDTVVSLEGSDGEEFGIEHGYASGDLAYVADWWAGAANDGEFGVTGTTFTRNGGVQPITIGDLNDGVAALDSRTGTGYLMYSQQDVYSRFGAYAGNSDHIIAVYYSGGQWYVDKNFSTATFVPEPDDVLLAAVDFTNDTASSLEGSVTVENGIQRGYTEGDLVYIADWWAGAANDGEFGVTGTYFIP